MPFFKKQQTQKREQRQEPAAEPLVTVRVVRPGYSTHEVPMPVSYLGRPHFTPLMAEAEKEFGVHQGDVIAIPRKFKDVLDAMVTLVSTTIDAPLEPPQDDRSWWPLAVEDGYADKPWLVLS